MLQLPLLASQDLLSETIVLDSLSKGQSTQGLDGEFWRQELAEEGDYLSGTCCGKDFAQRVEAESEQRARAATMVFDRNGMQARHGDAGFDGGATAKASSASKVQSLSGSVRCVASSAKPLVLRLPNMVSMVRNWRGAGPCGWARFQF